MLFQNSQSKPALFPPQISPVSPLIIITAVSANGCNSAVTKTGKRGTKDEMTGAKDGDRPLSSDDRVHVRIKRFSQKEAGRKGGGVLENCTQGLTLSDEHTYLAPRKCLIYSIELFQNTRKHSEAPKLMDPFPYAQHKEHLSRSGLAPPSVPQRQ